MKIIVVYDRGEKQIVTAVVVNDDIEPAARKRIEAVNTFEYQVLVSDVQTLDDAVGYLLKEIDELGEDD